MIERWMITAMAVSVPTLFSTGVAQADEINQNSYNGDGTRLTILDLGQVDDPAEDVLEHFLHLGSFFQGPEPAETPQVPDVPDPVDVPSVAAVPAAYR